MAVVTARRVQDYEKGREEEQEERRWQVRMALHQILALAWATRSPPAWTLFLMKAGSVGCTHLTFPATRASATAARVRWDTTNPPAQAMKVAEAFSCAALLEHPGGHVVPMDEKAMRAYLKAMR